MITTFDYGADRKRLEAAFDRRVVEVTQDGVDFYYEIPLDDGVYTIQRHLVFPRMFGVPVDSERARVWFLQQFAARHPRLLPIIGEHYPADA